jgi:N-methylhydantoinase A/oxoprolinase/acetone carboxylase beta subunit
MEQYNIAPEDVNFIAHGTTQATNALLEGDVAKVGVVTLGQGLEGAKSKSDTTIGSIELAPKKYLESENSYVETSASDLDAVIRKALASIKK